MYRLMLLSRRIDDKEIQLKRRTRSSSKSRVRVTKGVLVAAGKALRPRTTGSIPTIATARSY